MKSENIMNTTRTVFKKALQSHARNATEKEHLVKKSSMTQTLGIETVVKLFHIEIV